MSRFPTHVALSNVTVSVAEQPPIVNPDGSITVHIPITFKRHGGRKYIITPNAMPDEYTPPKEKESLLKALGQAFEWKAMLDEGRATSMTDLSTKARGNPSYVARVLRLTLLAPDIVEAILNGKQPKELSLLDIFRSLPYDWNEQRKQFGFVR